VRAHSERERQAGLVSPSPIDHVMTGSLVALAIVPAAWFIERILHVVFTVGPTQRASYHFLTRLSVAFS
jgi:hypothetical protein